MGAMNSKSRNDCRTMLAHFHNRFLSPQSQEIQNSIQLQILWHTACTTLFIDIDLLERAVGREGSKCSSEEHDILMTWAKSDDAQRCVIHGLMIKKYVEEATCMSEPAMHVPRALFWASLAIFCFVRYRPRDSSSSKKTRSSSLTSPAAAEGFHHSHHLGQDLTGPDGQASLHDFNTLTANNASLLKTALFAMTDLLRHVGHWEIGRKFAAIMTALCNFEFENP